MFFNNNNQFKYDLTSFICQQSSCSRLFDNVMKLRNYVLNYYDVDIESVEFKYHMHKINNDEHAQKHVYNFFSFFFMSYATIQNSIFDWNLTSCLNINENVFLCQASIEQQAILAKYENLIAEEERKISECWRLSYSAILLRFSSLTEKLKSSIVSFTFGSMEERH